MNGAAPAYGLWTLVVLNSLVFIIFAFSFAKPQSKRDRRSFGAFSAFLVALFTEMYGFPLTIYLLSGWLTTQYSSVDWLAHDSGHLPEMLFGWRGNPHLGPFHWISTLLTLAMFPVLVFMYVTLARREEREALAEFGDSYRAYMREVPAFVNTQ